MTERNYNQDEIDLLKGYYGGTTDDWDDYTLDPDGSVVPDQNTAITSPDGDISYADDSRYSPDYSAYFSNNALNVSSVGDARKVSIFFHEGWHQKQVQNMSQVDYLSYVGREAGGNYNYDSLFDPENPIPFEKLSAEQQAEVMADYKLIQELNALGENIDPTLKAQILADMRNKGEDGTVGTYSEEDYEEKIPTEPAEMDEAVEQFKAYKRAQDNKHYDDMHGGRARPVGDGQPPFWSPGLECSFSG